MSFEQRTVTVVGLGAIGSFLVLLLARLPFIRRLVLVDPDSYGLENLTGQNIGGADVGVLKVVSMQKQIAGINKDATVETHALPVEDVPLGALRSDLLISCVDSRLARQSINAIACRLGVPWIDGAVEGSALLGRVAVYPARGACLECRWGAAEYNLLEQVHKCQCESGPAPTNAPAEVGALVAAHQVIAARELLTGDFRSVEREAYFNARSRHMSWVSFRRNSNCRFDHRAQRIAGEINLRSGLVDLLSAHGAAGLSVEGHQFAFEAACPRCCEPEAIEPTLSRAWKDHYCRGCGSPLSVNGFHTRDRLSLERCGNLTLADVGLLESDIVTLHRQPASGNIFIDLEIGRSS